MVSPLREAKPRSIAAGDRDPHIAIGSPSIDDSAGGPAGSGQCQVPEAHLSLLALRSIPSSLLRGAFALLHLFEHDVVVLNILIRARIHFAAAILSPSVTVWSPAD